MKGKLFTNNRDLEVKDVDIKEGSNQLSNRPCGKNNNQPDQGGRNLPSGCFRLGLVSTGNNPADTPNNQNKEKDNGGNNQSQF